MNKLNSYNICALTLLLILIVTIRLRGMLKDRRNRFFWYVLLVELGSVVFDITAVRLDNDVCTNLAARYISHSGYLILHNLTAPFFIIYLVELTGTWYQQKRHRFKMFLMACPVMTALSYILASPVTHELYYIDENYTYVRGAYFPLLYVSAAFYICYGAFYLKRYRRLFDKWTFISGVFVFLAMPLAAVIQFFRPGVSVEMFSQALGTLLIMLIIQRPEERLESVTGLNKYEAFISDLRKAYYNEKPLQIILIRIINFKSLNDMLGYTDTNEMLRLAADIITENSAGAVSDADAYYFGRGIFCVALGPEYFSQTERIADNIHRTLEKSVVLKQMDINVLAGLCIARCPEDLSDFQMAVSFANGFEWEHNTENVIHAADIIHDGHYEMLHHMDAIIEDALANDRFSVYYQPIYSVKDNRFHSAEALLRLKDEKYGFVPPDLFIPVAERNGSIHRIGAYVLEEVCRFIASDDFEKLGLEYIEVNLSVTQCMRRALAQEVCDILKKYNVDPARINLEITETAAAYAQGIMMENLHALSEAGIALSLDDFGTGYSNMQRVASLPLHMVKLDKTFTNLEKTPKLEIVMRNTIRMIKDMEMKIVAEGIETADMVKQFADLECEYIQGYYYSKPLPKGEFIGFVKENKGA